MELLVEILLDIVATIIELLVEGVYSKAERKIRKKAKKKRGKYANVKLGLFIFSVAFTLPAFILTFFYKRVPLSLIITLYSIGGFALFVLIILRFITLYKLYKEYIKVLDQAHEKVLGYTFLIALGLLGLFGIFMYIAYFQESAIIAYTSIGVIGTLFIINLLACYLGYRKLKIRLKKEEKPVNLEENNKLK